MERLLYISTAPHLENIEAACAAGCKWIQLRVKEPILPHELLSLARASKSICDRYGAHLSVNDYPEIAAAANAYGAHVGLGDRPVSEARQLLGTQPVLGATANTPEQALLHVNAGANYIGYGPFRFTTTKEKLSPVLGLDGYRHLMETLQRANVRIPVLAIGGIGLEDIAALRQAGVYGVAVSGLIMQAGDKQDMVTRIQKALS
ncbi:thiamine phosphate synthase [Chitinophaga lutea]